MNADLMADYIEFIADRLLLSLGFAPLFNKDNPVRPPLLHYITPGHYDVIAHTSFPSHLSSRSSVPLAWTAEPTSLNDAFLSTI